MKFNIYRPQKEQQFDCDCYPIGSYEIDPMPGCPRVGISHGLVIYPEFRGKGNGTKAMEERIENARKLGYDVLIATVICGNIQEEKILRNFGWKEVTIFLNHTPMHDSTLWYKNISDP